MGRKRAKIKGRSESGQFLQLPKSVINRKEFYSLRGNALKLLIDLYSQFNGFNNGDLCMAWSMMEKRSWRSRDTLNRSRKELLDTGFVIVSRQGGRNRATLYAITFLAIDDCKGKLDIKETVAPPHYWKK